MRLDRYGFMTEYSAEGSLRISMRDRACFKLVFQDASHINGGFVHYTINLYKGTELGSKGMNNNCLLSIPELTNHLRAAQSLFPFKFKITEQPYTDSDEVKHRYVVELFVEGVPNTFHKYLLSWVRYAYEFPFNLISQDVRRLTHEPRFRFISSADLYNYILARTSFRVNSEQNIVKYKVNAPLTNSELREKIKNVSYLNDIYKELTCDIDRKLPGKIDTYTQDYTEYWEPKFYPIRRAIYLNI